jgi:tRNA(Ile)-lysidine synthase
LHRKVTAVRTLLAGGAAGDLSTVPPGLPLRVRRHVRARRFFAEPGLAVLAVSGGADSLALLDLFATLGPALGLDLLVAHADHGIHPASAEVAAHVARLAARRYRVETVVGTLELGPGASETKARTARYRFLRQVQAERGARYLLTAHHADDQVETVLLRLLRGSAPAGLAGIPERGPRGLVRPLLPFSREELRRHVERRRLEPFEDPANRDPRHLRSWVRTVVLPTLAARLGPEGPAALLEVAGHARAERRAWDAALDQLPGLDLRASEGRFDVAREVLSGYDKWLASRALRAASTRAGIALAPRAASRLARFSLGAASGRRLALGDGLVAEVAFDRLRVWRPGPEPAEATLDGARGSCDFGRYRLCWRRQKAPRRMEREAWTTWFDAGPLAVRPVEEGDRLVPLGGAGRRKVSRLLMEAKVPRGERAGHPILLGAGGDVVWVPGVCRGAAAVPAPGASAMRVDVTVL